MAEGLSQHDWSIEEWPTDSASPGSRLQTPPDFGGMVGR
jgi:hypothetical protein